MKDCLVDQTTPIVPASVRRSYRTALIVNGPEAVLGLFESTLEPGRAYSRIRIVQPDLVVVCVLPDDPGAIRVLSMLALDPATAAIPVVTYPIVRAAARPDGRSGLPDRDEFLQAAIACAAGMN
jgi:hypothetical protein